MAYGADTMPEPTPTGTRRIELYVREDLPEPTRERAGSLRTELEALVADDTVASVSINSWEKRTRIDSSDDAAPYVSFREWAGRVEVTLSPFFDSRTCYSVETGYRHEYRVRPAFCMAVYEDDDLLAVYPHRGERTRSVMDGIEALREGTADPATPSRRSRPSAAD